jgi:hypothetical protein
MHFLAAARLAENFLGAVGDHFVGVHVDGRARAGLKNIDDKLLGELAIHDFGGGLANRCGQTRLEQTQLFVGRRGGALDHSQRADERARKTDAAHRKFSTARCVCAS